MRFKDTIKVAKQAIKLADKNPMLYTDEEVHYMRLSLRAAKEGLKRKREMNSKGFKDESTTGISPSGDSDTRSGKDNGIRGKGKQSKQSGKS